MIDISLALSAILTRLNALPVQHFIELRTFKKDRSIKIIKIAEEELRVIENGYSQKTFQTAPDKLKKLLKRLIKKEFPRSNKAHLHSGELPKDLAT